MNLLKVKTPDKIKEKIKEHFSNMKIYWKEVSINEAFNRYLYEDIKSNINLPDYRKSTVDGYAVVAKDTYGASESMPVFLDVKGEVNMGEEPNFEISQDFTGYVPTGGMIPNGADAMVMIEFTEKLDEKTIAINKPSAPNDYIVQIGEDIKKDEVVLKRGRKLTAQDIGALSAIGMSKVKVFKKPKVAIISTGDEIIPPDKEINIGQTRDINSYTIKALVENYGGEVTTSSIVKDNYEDLRKSVEEAINNGCQLVILSGGSSVGLKDVTAKVLDSFGEPGVFVHGAAVKPGKPTIISYAQNTGLIGLPGHPVSAVVVFKIFGKYMFDILLNRENKVKSQIEAICTKNVHSAPGRETYQMVKLIEENEIFYAEPLYAKSAAISLLTKAEGYIKIEINQEGIEKGQKVKVYLE